MTLSELINQLSALAEDLNPSGDLFAECDPTVMITYQPSRPPAGSRVLGDGS